MNIKAELSTILALSGHKRRNTLRYLSKRNPEIWDEMIQLTSFLPTDASAPQRTWHIMNDINEIPKCPITQQDNNWIGYEQGYTKHSTRKASRVTVAEKLSESTVGAGHWRNKDTKKATQANQKFSAGFKEGKHKPIEDRNRDTAAIAEKAAETCLERYGVDNYRKSAEFKLIQKHYYDEKFKETRERRTEREKYYEEVGYYTERNWNEHFYKINPTRLERGPELHLDHIYSRAEGFKQGIAAEIIGHWTNLRLLSRLENSSKRDRCDKTLGQLLEDFKAVI